MADMLAGIRVVSAESFGVVPGTTAILRDMGATVIKIEPPNIGDSFRRAVQGLPEPDGFPGNSLFDIWNRGKHSLTLNLATPEGHEVLMKLLESADIFTHNLRATFLGQHGLDYETISARFPGLIYASFTGYGDKGIDKDRDGLGPVALWTRSGLAAYFGDEGAMPEPTRGAMDDTIATLGFLGCVLGALVEKQQSGLGQKVTTSHYHIGTWINTLIHSRLSGEEIPDKSPHFANATRAFYQCADRRWLLIAGPGDGHWRGLCNGIGRPDLIEDPRFANILDRRANNEVLCAILKETFATKPAGEFGRAIADAGGVADVAMRVDDIIEDPQAHDNGFFMDIETPNGTRRLLTPPLEFSRTPLTPRGPAPRLGEHTDETLAEAGYSAETIAKLRADGII